MDILIILEESKDSLHRLSLETVTAAQSFAENNDLSLGVLALGGQAGALAEKASTLDVGEVLIAEHDLIHMYSADGYTQVLEQVIKQEKPQYVFTGYTYRTRDFMPRVGARLERPFLADTVAFSWKNGSPVFIKQVFNGKLSAEVTCQSEPPWLVGFQAAAFQADAVRTGKAPIRRLTVDLDPERIQSAAEEPFQESGGEVDLSSAHIIVSIGRGIGKEENVPLAKALADSLGGELGSSRPVVDAGWLSASRQVGSSGQNVSPKLYMALGISGAIQHVVGMKGAKNIIAVNKDPDAPIFEIADYGLVVDLMELLPRLTEAIDQEK